MFSFINKIYVTKRTVCDGVTAQYLHSLMKIVLGIFFNDCVYNAEYYSIKEYI